MPGIFRRTWNKVRIRADKPQAKNSQHKLTRKERRRIGRLVAGYTPKTETRRTREQDARAYFYTARAEAKRQRRRRRRVNEALAGGWGQDARQAALGNIVPDRKVEAWQ